MITKEWKEERSRGDTYVSDH
jgi:hypothetical protein